MRRTREEAEKTRQRILEAAFEVFSEKGYHEVTMSMIARRVNMTNGAIYWHFENKGKLFVLTLERQYEQLKNQLKTICEKPHSIEDLRVYFDYILGDESNSYLNSSRIFFSHHEEWPDFVREKVRDLRDNLFAAEKNYLAQFLSTEQKKGNIRKGIDPVSVAGTIVSVFYGLLAMRVHDLLPRDFKDDLEYIFGTVKKDFIYEVKELKPIKKPKKAKE